MKKKKAIKKKATKKKLKKKIAKKKAAGFGSAISRRAKRKTKISRRTSGTGPRMTSGTGARKIDRLENE